MLQSKRSSMKVRRNILEWSTAAKPGIPEYKTWKKNSPFLYDMILR